VIVVADVFAVVVGAKVAIVVVTCWVVFDAVRVVVVAGDSHWLWLCYRACIAISCACGLGLLLHLVGIQFGFGDFGW